ncbi:MAG: DUF5686 and carboxypeptidase regulatory-like domain-containing protein [Cytophagaceae bacterium]|jgi:hypothetical protein|nr:DUF5686 and carboxypeptidase regulatory-like domain-containing protein [Cytophagaceae bacterium]
MKIRNLKSILFFAILLITVALSAQSPFVIKGKITDAESGEPVPFATIFIQGTNFKAQSDFEGNYTLKALGLKETDTVVVSAMGYSRKKKPVSLDPMQPLDFQMQSKETVLKEVVVTVYENPAFRIMRKAVNRKKNNDKRALSSYQYESYTKIEVSLDNISDKMKSRKVFTQIQGLLDTAKALAGEDGSPVVPVFISESVSDIYHNENPDRNKEVVKATRITGIGIDDGSLVSQVIGSSYQEYNFYRNWLNILSKDFISPLADSWQTFYEVELVDTTELGGIRCFKIDVRPKQPQDLAFTGSLWIADSSFALKQIDVTIGKQANLNFIEKIKIQQELLPTSSGPWMPVKTRVLVDIYDFGTEQMGILAKFYNSIDSIQTNKDLPATFYDQLVVVNEDASELGKNMESFRHDTLSATERSMFQMVSKIKSVPLVRNYVEILKVAVNGYLKVGPLDIGPYLYLGNYNDIEGLRLSLGCRTNIDFSKKLVLKGNLAYGFLDQQFKYVAGGEYIFNRKRWTTLEYIHRYDIDQVSINVENLANNNIFLAFVRNGTLRGPYYNHSHTLTLQSDIIKGWTQKISLRTKNFLPEYPFAYYQSLNQGDSTLISQFSTTEAVLTTRLSRDERWIINDNQRLSLGADRWPILTIKNTFGLPQFLRGDFQYYKLHLGLSHNFRIGALGRSYYDIQAGRVFSKLPYPLLEVHTGNQTFFYTTGGFNLMNYFEFISDTYATLRYRHYFEGLFFNRIPLIKKWKWRFLATSNVVVGGLSKENISIIPPKDSEGNDIYTFYHLDQKPYVEVGYGVENIFKVLRVDFVHRLSYLDNPGIKKFGVKFSFQLTL